MARLTIYSIYVRSAKKKQNQKCQIQQWRFELEIFEYTIHYRPGLNNYAADLFSQVCSSLISASTNKNLYYIYENLL